MRMKRFLLAAGLAVSLNSALSHAQVAAAPSADTVPSREPFTLKLHDKDQDYEQHFDTRVPFVEDNSVYLFAGEKFGVNFKIVGSNIVGVTYQPVAKKADVWFTFTQEKQLAAGLGMTLVIQNRVKHVLRMDGLMTVPHREGSYKTGVLATGPGLSNFEAWPYPIVQLTLKNFRLSER